jgi:glutaredoxin
MAVQLYHRWNCPYSARVREFIESHGLKPQVEYVEIEEVRGAEDKLQDLTGRVQVPCLVINGTPMLESRGILEWLKSYLMPPVEAHI